MKKINLAIVAMTLLLAFLSYTLLEVRASAGITCQDLSGCCGAAACQGPGRPSGCTITCDGGGSASCCSNTSGQCRCSGGGGMDVE